ncbi:hypothetical protein BN1086_04928 [Citrobacter koseri]|uniref:Uncharacterized protein n=1 Tax=Citrobacter koseri TaxID=545 RepID=A0A078LNG3_CITKO|nr:hypothetical protein BN1086_04928 [Citrobacter koseri]
MLFNSSETPFIYLDEMIVQGIFWMRITIHNNVIYD